ncbi:hypothetical protein BP6252_10917 [Coleophoma cylindrospora]|uniref:Uncharacterized protein n=1 Tax=Coleophoma cylindrospora TaxID=1849047 RepID=A0A3D8QNJ7_9HELO|nr:hypothetical protein BP6252_10917 [Coleophoma cylindrospora]
MIEISAFASIAKVLGPTVDRINFVCSLKNAPASTKTCLDIVNRVSDDINFAILLRHKHYAQLLAQPETLRRLDSILNSAKESIEDVGRLLENFRPDVNCGKISLASRLAWMLSNQQVFVERKSNLQQQHAAINVEIVYMRQFELLPPLVNACQKIFFENLELMPPQNVAIRTSFSTGNGTAQEFEGSTVFEASVRSDSVVNQDATSSVVIMVSPAASVYKSDNSTKVKIGDEQVEKEVAEDGVIMGREEEDPSLEYFRQLAERRKRQRDGSLRNRRNEATELLI